MLRTSETHRIFSPAMKLTVLRRHPVFGGLPLEHIERLSTYASTRAYARGATIFTKGDPGTSLFAVCSGTIRIAVKTSWKPSYLKHKATLMTLFTTS